MVDVSLILLGIGLILCFGSLAEYIFRKTGLPDILFLIILGFVLGPYAFGVVEPAELALVAPVFVTFALIFLLFDGAFNINLASLVREFGHSFLLTSFNFIISVIVVTTIMFLGGSSWQLSLLVGFILGGISSAFVIPLLKQIKISKNTYSLLILESALTDVLCIVFSFLMIEIIRFGETVGIKIILTQLASLFAIAGLIGILAGLIWLIIVTQVLKEHNYMLVIAYLLLLYVVTEFIGGNGAIACLFFGIVLKNSKQLYSIVEKILNKSGKVIKSKVSLIATAPSELFFYHQISFFLKTFFFVYVGLLINLSDWKAVLLGVIISVALLFSRNASKLLTRKKDAGTSALVSSIFARGLAAAAIVQFAILMEVPQITFIAKVVYVVITLTIILSSVRVFMVKREFRIGMAKPE